MIRYIISLAIALSWSPVFAATYYVSTTGSNANSGGVGDPWLTPEYGAAHLASGDTLLIQAGTYQIATPTATYSAAIAPSANNTTIKASPGEQVILIGNGGVAPTNMVIGNGTGAVGEYRDNVTFDGFKIVGAAMMAYGSGINVQNCDISVGSDGWAGMQQGEVILVQGCTSCAIRNNKLHDNAKGALAAENSGNNSLIMAYVFKDLIVENNDIYNSYGHAITMKDDVDGIILRRNWLYNNRMGGIYTGNNDAVAYSPAGEIYQNIFASQGSKSGDIDDMGGFVDVVETGLISVYNNVFDYGGVGNGSGDLSARVGNVPLNWFNNIHHRTRNFYVNMPYSGSVFPSLYHDYNNYYGGPSSGWKYRGTAYTFDGWKTFAEVNLLSGTDAHSVVTDPGFINTSGTFSQAIDFKRASYPTNGRGGSYPSVIGAYITGNEVIGASLDYTPASCDSSHLNLCTTQTPCLAAGGYWWSDGTCHSSQEVIAGSSSIRSINGELRKVNGHLIGISQ